MSLYLILYPESDYELIAQDGKSIVNSLNRRIVEAVTPVDAMLKQLVKDCGGISHLTPKQLQRSIEDHVVLEISDDSQKTFKLHTFDEMKNTEQYKSVLLSYQTYEINKIKEAEMAELKRLQEKYNK